MTALDIAVLIVIGWTALRGVMRGFVAEVIGIAGIFAGMLALRAFHAALTGLLAGFIGTDAGAAILAFVLIFGGVAGGARLIAAKAGRTSRESVLGPIDRALGFGLGAVKGLLFATVAFMAATLVFNALYGADERRPEWMRAAHVFPLLSASANAMSAWLEETSGKGGIIGAITGPGTGSGGNESDGRD